MQRFEIIIVILLVVFSLTHDCVNARKPIDYDALEKSWEKGDAETEILTDDDLAFRKLERGGIEVQDKLGPQMIFVTLQRSSEKLYALASRWKEMLWNGGVEVNCYDVGEGKLLVGLKNGERVSDVKKFLLDQHEVIQFEFNGETIKKKVARPRKEL